MKFCPHVTRPRDDKSGREKTNVWVYIVLYQHDYYTKVYAQVLTTSIICGGTSRDIVQIFAPGPKKIYSSFGPIAIIMHYIIIVPVVRRVTTNRARIVVGTRDHG